MSTYGRSLIFVQADDDFGRAEDIFIRHGLWQ